MIPKIVDKEQIILAGFSFYGDPFELRGGWTEENEIGRLWQRFLRYMDEHNPSLNNLLVENVMYEVHIIHDETPRTGVFEVFTGFEVTNPLQIPVQMLAKILPASRYAVFTLEGEAISSDWHKSIESEWLPLAEYEMAGDFEFQYYDERFKGVDKIDESLLDVYIPVVNAK